MKIFLEGKLSHKAEAVLREISLIACVWILNWQPLFCISVSLEIFSWALRKSLAYFLICPL